MDVLPSLFLVCLAIVVIAVEGNIYNLTLLHTNDVHARFEQTDKYSSKCSDSNAAVGKCYGGIARRVTKVREIRASHSNVLFVDAGDQYQGTLWFYVHKGNAAAYFMNKIGYDVMALGNHEFDNNVAGLTPFLKNVTFPVLSCNIDASLEPSMQGLFEKSTVKTIGGQKIGIIGYTTRTTPDLASTGKLVFKDEVASIQEEVDKLTAQGINKIIAVGHAGFKTDKDIAERVKGLDVVVGGHTNTFLYTGDAPSNDKPVAAYPQVVTQSSGDRVLVVQDYAYGKYLGYLQLTFDNSGKVTSWNGNPILLDKSIKEDNSTLEDLDVWKVPINALRKKVAGKSQVFLNGDRNTCRLGECNMGNLITDAVVHTNLKYPDSTTWAKCSVAMINTGAIRDSINPGNVMYEDILQTIPFRNTLSIVELKGKHLLAVLEHSVSQYRTDDPWPGFLQYSGIRVTYDLERPVNQRVVKVDVKCTECRVPIFEPLKTEHVYQILTWDYMINGGNDYTMIKDNMLRKHNLGVLATDAMIDYFTAVSPVTTGMDGRIKIVRGGHKVCSASEILLPYQTTTLLSLLLVCILSI